jgi:hypothetical protein
LTIGKIEQKLEIPTNLRHSIAVSAVFAKEFVDSGFTRPKWQEHAHKPGTG